MQEKRKWRTKGCVRSSARIGLTITSWKKAPVRAEYRCKTYLNKGNGVNGLAKFLVLGWFVFFGTAAPLAWAQSPQGALQSEKVVLQLRWLHQFQFAGYYAAAEQGYYAQEGLDVEIRPASPAMDKPTEIVTSGLADYGVTNSGLLLARLEGAPVVAMAAIFQESPRVWLTRADSGIERIEDLADKRLMMMLPRTESIGLWGALIKAGLDPKGMDIQPMSFDLEDLIEGRVDAFDAYATNEPYELESRGIAWRALSPRLQGINFYSDVLFTTEKELKERPLRAKAMLRASIKGWQYAMDHTEEVIHLIHRKYAPQKSLDHLRFEAAATRRLIQPEKVEIGHMNPRRWEAIGKTYVELGEAKDLNRLRGFIYRPGEETYQWAVDWLGWVGAAMALLLFFLVNAWRLNRQLKKEVHRRRESEEKLEALQTRYRQLFELAPVPMILAEPQGAVIRYINQRAREMFLRDQASDPVGRSANDFYANQEDRQRFAEQLRNTGQVRDLEAKVINPSGRVYWTNICARIVDFDGKDMVLTGLTDITRRHQLIDELHHRATTDFLTGCSNRGHFLEQAQREMERTRRYGRPLAVLMLDIDFFKQVNDRFGHQVGDQAIQSFVASVAGELRSVDQLGRLGGEEFAALLPETDSDGAGLVAERVRQAVEAQELKAPQGPVKLTVSIGVSLLRETDGELKDLLSRADRALYQAKEQGRNRIAYLP